MFFNMFSNSQAQYDLTLHFQNGEKELLEFAPDCTEIDIPSCSVAKISGRFPPSLKSLRIGSSDYLNKLPALPTGLQDLSLGSCIRLPLPKLPDSLQKLSIKNSPVATMTCLPSSLKHLDIDNCHHLRSLRQVPESLEYLRIWYCGNFIILESLPPTLQSLFVRGCATLNQLPEFPPSLQQLSIWYCPELRRLPPLPDTPLTLDLQPSLRPKAN